MKKYIPFSLFFIILLVSFFIHAISISQKTPFNDIDNCEYKNSIIELYQEGVVVGVGNGEFQPNREITIYEFCTMLARGFYSDYDFSTTNLNAKWYSPYTDTLIRNGVIDGYDFYNWEQGDYNSASFIERALLCVEYYDRPLDINSFIKRVEKTAIDSGLIPNGYDCSKKMTRGEAAEIINKILNDDFKRVEYAADFPVSYKLDSFKGMDNVFRQNLIYLKKIPNKYIELFNQAGYTYVITNSCEKYYPEYQSAVGMTDCHQRRVYIGKIANVFIVQHEFGHVISSEIFDNNNRVLSFIYEKEKNSALRFVGDYALTNSDEFFAEVFSYLLSNRDNENVIRDFREANPLTTAIILDNMINYEGLVNMKEINKIID